MILEAASQQGPNFASRRNVLALAGAAAAAPVEFGLSSSLATVDAAKKKSNNNQNKNDKQRKRKQRDLKNDIAVLNYALTLEHLEYAFYRDGLAQFDANDFNGFIDPDLFARLGDIRAHEQTHVDTLTSIIQDAGGTPVAECTYDFGPEFTTPSGFLGIAQLLENTGVMAYDGALATINSADYQTAGATIATVEARHASYLNLINDDNPFPDAFDMPKSQSEILAAAGGFIVSCP